MFEQVWTNLVHLDPISSSLIKFEQHEANYPKWWTMTTTQKDAREAWLAVKKKLSVQQNCEKNLTHLKNKWQTVRLQNSKEICYLRFDADDWQMILNGIYLILINFVWNKICHLLSLRNLHKSIRQLEIGLAPLIGAPADLQDKM